MKKIFQKIFISDRPTLIFSRYETGTTGIFFYALDAGSDGSNDDGVDNVHGSGDDIDGDGIGDLNLKFNEPSPIRGFSVMLVVVTILAVMVVVIAMTVTGDYDGDNGDGNDGGDVDHGDNSDDHDDADSYDGNNCNV
jgi:hypothetical protein